MQQQQIKADQQMKKLGALTKREHAKRHNFGENITLAAREILEKRINQTAENLPMSLKVNHISIIMNCSKRQVYEMLSNDDLPGAKKIKGLGWRIPRDPFLSWWYGKEAQNEISEEQM